MVEKCVCCGAIIPEGRQVCPSCEEKENRLIDPSVLIRDLTAMKSVYDAIALDGIIKALKEAPAVDAVEVVRCGKCKSRPKGEYGMCHKLCRQTHEDDFCSYGERRTDNEQN